MIGPINPLALQEYDALAERHAFLQQQLDDVKESRRELLRVIRAVDREIVSVFQTAFQDVSEHFSALFATLFPGGSGRVFLTEPDDVLNTGIEIEARPSGKNVRRLSLLSGGERSLTALAFLFAVFRARRRPSTCSTRSRPRSTTSTSTVSSTSSTSSATRRSWSSSPTRSARWRRATSSTASRCRRAAPARSSASGSRKPCGRRAAPA